MPQCSDLYAADFTAENHGNATFFPYGKRGVIFGICGNCRRLIEEFVPIDEQYKIYQKRRNVFLSISTENLGYNTTPVSRSIASRQKAKQVDSIFSKAFENFAEQRGCTCLLFNNRLTLFHIASDAAQITRSTTKRV